MSTNPLLAAALGYAARGWHVVAMHHPLPSGSCDCGDPQCEHIGKHPRWHRELLTNGAKSASRDPELLTRWWSLWPDANVGIAMGASGLVALDEDPRNGGDLSNLAVPPEDLRTLTSRSGGGGRHLIFTAPADFHLDGKPALPGIDVLVGNAILMAPPSLHLSGQHYRWEDGLGPDDGVLRPLPASVADLLQPTPEPRSSVRASPLSETIPEGERNTVLTSLAGSMRRRGMSQAAIEAALLAENSARCVPPLNPAEVRAIAASVSRYAPEQSNRYQSTEFGNARRLVDHHGHELRFCHPWNKWLVWDGRRWQMDVTAEVARRAKATISAIIGEAASLDDEEERKALFRWALRSETYGQLQSMLALAAIEQEVSILPDALDTDPWLLNCHNGTLDLRTATLRPHRPQDYLTQIASVDYDPAALAPTWHAFLAQMLEEDWETIGYLQRLVGYSLTGEPSERILPILWGGGANGKSTFLETLATMLGDYAKRTPAETLLSKRAGSIPNDIARLQGSRFVVASESDETRRLDEAIVKHLTGNERVTVRFMRAEWFEFNPAFTLWLATNHRPIITGTDDAIWDRIRLIHFSVRLAEEERDKTLLHRLHAELPGILAWAVQGCLDYQREGLKTSARVRSVTAEYRQEMDDVGQFLDDCCVFHANHSVPVAILYEAYRGWCALNGDVPMSKRQLGSRLRAQDFLPAKSNHTRLWRGLDLRSNHEPDDDGTQRDTQMRDDAGENGEPSYSNLVSRTVPSASSLAKDTETSGGGHDSA
jgi:putative DNA primase/helicase